MQNPTIKKMADSLADYEKGPGTIPPSWVRDKIADEAFAPGYKGAQRSRKNQCEVCFTAKSITGTCGC
jgi:hypothetical protein